MARHERRYTFSTRQLPTNRVWPMPGEIEPLSSPRMARCNCEEEATVLGISSWRRTAAPCGSHYLYGDLGGCLSGRIGTQLSVNRFRKAPERFKSRACIADKIRESLPPDLTWRFASARPFLAIERAAKRLIGRAIKGVPRRTRNHSGWVAILMGDYFRHDPEVGTGANLGM